MASAAMTVEDQGGGSKSNSLPLTCHRNSLDVTSLAGKDAQLKEQYPSVNDCSLKVRKPYTITKQRERWTEEEHKKFIEGLKIHGRAWQSIEEHVGTKSAVQIRSHAQKFFSKVARESTNSNTDSVKPIEIPPPRPKRKPIHPYPRKLVAPAFESDIMGTADSYAPKVGISQVSSVDDKQGSSFLSQLDSSLEAAGSSLRVQLTANSLADEDVSVGQRGFSKLNIVLPRCNRISLDVSSHNGKDVQLKEKFPSGNGCAIKVVWESSTSDANSVKPIDTSHASSKSKLVNRYPCKPVGNSAESEILDRTDSNTPILGLLPVSSAANANKGGIFLSQPGSSPEGTGSSFQALEPASSSPDGKALVEKKVISKSSAVLPICNKISLEGGLQIGPKEKVHSGNGSPIKVVQESINSDAHSVKPTEISPSCLKEKVLHPFPGGLVTAAFESETLGTTDSRTPNGSSSPFSSAGDANRGVFFVSQSGPSPEGTGSSFNIQLPDSSPDGDVPVEQGGAKSSTVLRTRNRIPLDVGTNSGTDSQQKEHFHSGVGCALKARKPYTITKQRERWTEEEHGRFVEALKLYGRAWRKIEEHVGTKTAIQIRSHAQKFFSKVVRESFSSEANSVKTIEIPPPRPKRKPAHPYPRKLAVPFESEMQCTADSKTPNDLSSPVSSAADANNDCFLYTQPDSSPEGTGSSFQIQQPASSPLDEEIPTKQEKSPPVTDSLADLASTQSLKLFGKTVLVADPKKPSLPNAGTSESSPGVNSERPAHIVPWNFLPPVGTWDTSVNYFMQYPGEIPQPVESSVPSLPWCAFYVGLPFPSLQLHNPVTMQPEAASLLPGQSEDREVHQEGSYSGSDAGSVNAGEGGDRDWEVEVQSEKAASDNGGNEQQTEVAGQKAPSAEVKPRPDKSLKGFVPYKRCITERETQSSTMTVQDSDERRIRLCL